MFFGRKVPEVSVTEVADVPAEGQIFVDVREPYEWAAGHIEQAVHIPMQDVPQRLGELTGRDAVIVCRSGVRSAQVTAYLVRSGFSAVNLAGGMRAWQHAARPMVSDTGQPPAVA